MGGQVTRAQLEEQPILFQALDRTSKQFSLSARARAYLLASSQLQGLK